MPDRLESVAVAVVTHNSASVVEGLLHSLASAFGSIAYEVFVVDNASTDDTLGVVRRTLPQARVLGLDQNLGYAAAVNRVMTAMDGHDALLVLNPDVRLDEACVAKLAEALQATGAGIAVPRLRGAEGSTALSLRRTPTLLRALGEAVIGGTRAGRIAALGEMVVGASAYESGHEVDWATGAVLLVVADCLTAVGGLDESFFLYSEETDLALRARDAGFVTTFVPSATAHHIGGESMTSAPLYALLTLNRIRLHRKRRGWPAALAFGAAILLGELLRSRSPLHRHAARTLLSSRRRRGLVERLSGVHPSSYICFSAQDWWYHNRAHSDFQLLRRVARTRRVLFVNSIGLRMPMPGRSTAPARRILRKLGSVARFIRRPDPATPNFAVMTPLAIPLYHRPLVRRCNALLVRFQVRLAARIVGVLDPTIIVTIPTAVDVVEGMRARSVIYNRSDKHSEFGEADQPTIAALEDRLLRLADHVLYVSHELMDLDAALVHDRAEFIDHGVDLDHFNQRALPADLAAIPGPRVGFFGGLDEYVVDFDLLERLATSLPEISLVLIGDAGDSMERFAAVPNVHWLGFRDYEEIPAYGSGFDVAIMPWRQNDWIRFCNPIKTKEYLALGLPIVSIDFPEGHRYDGLIRWASRPDEFVALVRESLADGGAGTPESRRQSVSTASWDQRADWLMQLAEREG